MENARLYEQAERIATLEERRRIAAEMHDGLGQTLSYLGLMTDQVVDLLSNGNAQDATKKLHRTRETIERATSDVRKAINSLMDESPISQELCDRLDGTAKEFSSNGNIAVEWIIEKGSQCNYSPRVNEQIIHVVREALTNAVRHSHATHISMRLKQGDQRHLLLIEDNGMGFESTKPGPHGHFGLRIMKARASQIGGQIEVASAPGMGTQVVLSWPLESAKQASL